MGRLVDQFREALAAFADCRVPPALIGGLALTVHGVIRATQDVDFLVAAEDFGALHERLLGLGYRCVHRSDDVANYRRDDQALDLLLAHRTIARQLLSAAVERVTSLGAVRVVSAEGLIAFKLQGFVNDPRRTQDLEDIRALMRTHRGELDLDEVRGYFRLFEREALFDELIAQTSRLG
jgi:hypothetical protein